MSAEADEILAANAAFYAALAGGDYAAMEDLWARSMPVTCLHPGWQPLSGREAVRESWARIIANPAPTRIACRDASVQVLDDFAIVICTEAVDRQPLAATNLFVREDGRWRLVHHQSGMIAEVPTEPADEPGRRLH